MLVLGSVSAGEMARCTRSRAEILAAPQVVLSDSGGLRREFRADRSRILRLQHKRDENSGFSAHSERECRASIFEARSIVGLSDRHAVILCDYGQMATPDFAIKS